MESKIQKQIIDYFSYFEEFYNSSKTSLKYSQNCAASINKLINRCRNIKEADLSGSPLEEFSELQNKLSASIHNLISEEIQTIRSKLSILEDLLEKLCNKNKVFRESSRELNCAQISPLIQGTPLQPPLQQLEDFADDTITFASHICALIDNTLNVLTQKGLDTEIPIDNFRISTHWQRKVTEILTYTSFCSENQI